MKTSRWKLSLSSFVLLLVAAVGSSSAHSAKPNVLAIMVDDVAPNSLGAYSHGMQYPTPNIDRIAHEGALFTDHYAQPSCTAGRAAFLMGQLPIRTGLTTVGQPGNPLGIREEDPTLAEILKEEGYMTAQFGKNHLGDLDQHLPTLHGFDEFLGNLYHLNVSEEPEQADYPKSEKFREKFFPRGVIESYATGPGKQKITDTGQLTIERMKTFDEEILDRSIDFMKRANEAGKPFFVWHATSRMHVYTHLKEESRNLATPISSAEDVFGSGLMEHDGHVGKLLDTLDDLGIADNTIVIYTTDNGPESSSWPDAGTTWFRGEKMTTWEGGVRSPFLVRWPEKIPAGLKLNGISAHEDVLPTIAAAVGRPNIAEELKKSDKVYIDGVNNLDYWTGKAEKSARNHFFYYYESSLTAVRVGPWKMHFATKPGGRYYEDLIFHTMPKLFNLRKDPTEHYDGVTGFHQIMRKSWVVQPIIAMLTKHVETFKEFPPRQEAASLNINEAIERARSTVYRQ
ncbi:arylsulfatase [Marinobacter sp. CHS3-4]|uniref:arylsulfatase n=1 Tax=Marinobacter sp. CHS3-4 TaxID=3045174 RepID=UPI0024B4C029|nr:arylsulfatase [Marinobacter sp. CHS3-4]MDI9244259.1 arylsulfatase [Marinobacter sp. CHS3-4]